MICRFSESFKGGLGRIVNLAVFVFLALCILSPLFKTVNGDSGTIIFPELTAELTGEYDYYERLSKLTEEKLKETEKKALEQRFGCGDGDAMAEFYGTVQDSEYHLEKIILNIYSIKALSQRDFIRAYLEEKYICGVEVIELIKGQ